MKKTVLLLFWLMCAASLGSFAQQKIKDGTVSGGNLPNPNAILELESNNKGLLFPRVALTATTSPAPLTAFVNGMVVFDTATVNDVHPGFYYSDGTKWIRLSSATSTTGGWSLSGNSGTNPDSDFIGTNDNKPLVVKTNGTEKIRVNSDGNVGIGTNNPKATLDVQGDIIIGTLATGDITKDNILVVEPTTGRVKKVALPSSSLKVLKNIETVAADGKIVFDTPATITSLENIMLYRNGVMIDFEQNTNTTIKAEIACKKDDEIKIVQFLN